MFLSREIDIKLCKIYTKIHIFAAELPPMRVQYTGHVSLSVSRDQYTALPLKGVLVTIRFLWDNLVFRLVAYWLIMICLNLLLQYKVVYINEFSYILDTVLYQFHETGTSDLTFMGRDQQLK